MSIAADIVERVGRAKQFLSKMTASITKKIPWRRVGQWSVIGGIGLGLSEYDRRGSSADVGVVSGDVNNTTDIFRGSSSDATTGRRKIEVGGLTRLRTSIEDPMLYDLDTFFVNVAQTQADAIRRVREQTVLIDPRYLEAYLNALQLTVALAQGGQAVSRDTDRGRYKAYSMVRESTADRLKRTIDFCSDVTSDAIAELDVEFDML